MEKNLYINLGTFLNRFEVRPNGSYSFFLGSGTSVQSGIPTGAQLVWDFKRRLYCDHHRIAHEKLRDLQSSENQKMIQDFLESQKILPANPRLEYSFYFERCFPSSDDRKYYIQTKVSNSIPSIGHKCLGRLFVENVSDCIFTTNFDELIESGIQLVKPGHSFLVVSPEKHERIGELERASFSKVIKLHGDYRYDSLKNTTEELKSLDSNLAAFFKKIGASKGLIFVGYSGNDDSILTLLEEIVDNKEYFPHGLVWCLRQDQKPNERIESLLTRARAVNEHSGFLIIDNFDELAYLLYSKKCKRDEAIEKESKTLVNKKQVFNMDFALANQQPFILNAVEISKFPSTAYSVTSGDLRWADLKNPNSRDKVVYSLFKGKLYLWGKKDDCAQYLAELKINQTSTSIDLFKNKLGEESSFYQGMIYDALMIHFQGKGFQRFKRAGIFDPKSAVNDRSIPRGYQAFEAVELQLFWGDGKLRLLMAPTIYVKSPVQDMKNDPVVTGIVNRIKSNRYNQKVGELLKVWRSRLFQKTNDSFSLEILALYLTRHFHLPDIRRLRRLNFYKDASIMKNQKLFSIQMI
ncbi:SIR2 family protein [Bdellovibrio bacteriovorus]|uniref:SIR2 family protein n=1 Tax=Bdellovibrio bacteriovorus TaxID=959 RepID=UPI0035A697A0